MNHVLDKRVLKALRGIDQSRRSSHSYNHLSMVKDRLDEQHLQAAFIRAVLMIFILQKNYDMDVSNILRSYHYTNDRIDQILGSPKLLQHEKSRIQCMINDLKNIAESTKRNTTFDYALFMSEIPEEKNVNTIFSGERWLIYHILSAFYEGDKLYPQMYKWLYAYMLIKVDIRSEILQVNDNIGFHNFSIYTGRKGGFLYSNVHDRLMVKEAVKGSLQTGNIKSLEIRVRPGANAKENVRWILEYDRIIMEDDDLDGIDKNYFYYVFHFIKSQDKLLSKENYIEKKCRHFEKRKEWERQAEELIVFRNVYPEVAARVLGIDACSQEIGCRAEVFATVFRRLGQHIGERGLEKDVPQLKKTFHVGEDFLDIVDGLRAVDESLRFLNMQCGDRIGHGTVLGIDVYKWYQMKNHTIIISYQDYLDNIVWLYHKLIEFEISECEVLKSYLLREFDEYFSRIYAVHMQQDEIDRICLAVSHPLYQRSRICQFNIHNYYDAWKLRGDEPSLYEEGYLNVRKLGEFDGSVLVLPFTGKIRLWTDAPCWTGNGFTGSRLPWNGPGIRNRSLSPPIS